MHPQLQRFRFIAGEYMALALCSQNHGVDKGLDYEWDELLWSLVLSYNAAKQESTGVAPFTLLFAQEATVPPDLRVRPSLNFEEQEEKTHAEDLLQRATIVKKLIVHAGCSLEVAQHRDTLRYEHRRSGSYEPKPHQFKVGDFFYIRQKPRSGMEVATKPAILKLVKVRKDGVVVLEDSTKLREKSTVQSIAPCHLQVKNQYDCSAAIPSKHLACEECKRTDGEASMPLCDTCNHGYHIWCLKPALGGVPEGDWQCPKCLGTAVVAASAEVGISIVEKMAAVELQLKERLGADAKLLPADVGPHRAWNTVVSSLGRPRRHGRSRGRVEIWVTSQTVWHGGSKKNSGNISNFFVVRPALKISIGQVSTISAKI
ncbi:hypothetical protein CYMTET_56978 [Cymbomonas tetramitiformis]|uniref:PHD-type domain-containing protein n=1 Tax=Cymbomonas tetramitiformis TaxID=36881 RepID=A0AAE0BB73_9CHLO|nr:hypothetical protein CYMTET_56978 [Cymbomonas tetramitiformis]